MPPQSPGLVTVGYPVGTEDIGIAEGPEVIGISVG